MTVFNVKISYFAILRDETGLSSERLETSAQTAAAIFDEINLRYHFSLNSNRLRVAINDCFVDWQTNLKDNDEIVFIPPVAGG